MQSLKYTRARDQFESEAARPYDSRVLSSALVGSWVNTDKATPGILRLVLSNKEGLFIVQAFGACSPVACDWGEVEGALYSNSVDSELAVGFKAFYDFGFVETMLAAYLNKRILVVDTYNTFKDGSARSNYFSRDHFHQ